MQHEYYKIHFNTQTHSSMSILKELINSDRNNSILTRMRLTTVLGNADRCETAATRCKIQECTTVKTMFSISGITRL